MIEQLKKYVSNKERMPDDDILQITGSDAKLKQFASFWKSNGDTMQIISAVALHNWTTEERYNREELDCFKAGLAAMPWFFVQCCAIIEEKTKKDFILKKNNV
jgi:hypothetical protein